MARIRVLVADDMESMREYLQILLNKSKECECVGMAIGENDVVEKARQLKPDIILLDIQMERVNSGLCAIPKIFECSPYTKIVILTVHNDRHMIFEAIRLGAANYVIKNQSWDDILKTILNTYEGKNYLKLDIAQKLLDEIKILETKQESLLYLFSKFASLSSGEIEIIHSMCDGKNVLQIAEERFVEPVTIRSNLCRILKKMSYKNSKELIEHVKELKLFELIDSIK